MNETYSHLDQVAAHFTAARHPIIQSYEPGEDWWLCSLDDLALLVDGAASFAHP